MPNMSSEQPQDHEVRADVSGLTGNPDPSKNTNPGVDYEPHPENSIKLSPERQHIVDSICRLYSGSASEEDMQVYDEKAVYDDPLSYCDTRYKIAGQWYGIPKIMAKSQTLKTENVEDKPDRIIFKLQQEYTPRVLHTTKPVNSIVTLSLDGKGKVKYHKDQVSVDYVWYWLGTDDMHSGMRRIMTIRG